MRVLFGRKHGEQTEGAIVKVNRAKFKVRQVGSRGRRRRHPEASPEAVLNREELEKFRRWQRPRQENS